MGVSVGNDCNVELRAVSGYDGIYGVAADGRIWRYDRTWITGHHNVIKHHKAAGWVSRRPQNNGYILVTLKKDGGGKTFLQHRIVAKAWVPNPLGLPQVNHLNGVKCDNRSENLEWCTAGENMLHTYGLNLCASRRAGLPPIEVLQGILGIIRTECEAANG